MKPISEGEIESEAAQETTLVVESLIGNEDCTGEPPLKRFKHLNLVGELLKKKDEESQAGPQQISAEEEEIERYSKYRPTKDELQLDPIIYWVNAAHAFPHLSPVACDILSVPASSAPVERVFSVSGEASKGKRNRLADHNLERETLLRKNKKYLK